MMLILFAVLLILFAGSVNLVSFSITSNGERCPGVDDTLTCIGTEVPSLAWKINDSVIANYLAYNQGPQRSVFPISLYYTPGLHIHITTVQFPTSNLMSANIRSTLTASVSYLNRSRIVCTSLDVSSAFASYNFSVPVPPSPFQSATACYLSPNSQDTKISVSILWSPTFSAQYDVETYRVILNPATPSCPRIQIKRPSEHYSCSDLTRGRRHTLEVSAINFCGSQEGTRDTLTAYPRTPRIYNLFISYIYYHDRMKQMKVEWRIDQISRLQCSFNSFINYQVNILSRTRIQRIVSSYSCSDQLCSITVPLSDTHQNYNVSVTASNPLGPSSSQSSIIIPSFNVAHFVTKCGVSFLCSLNVSGQCRLQFGRDHSYQNLEGSQFIPINTWMYITLPQMSNSTFFYYQAMLNVASSSSYILLARGNFTLVTDPSSLSSSASCLVTLTAQGLEASITLSRSFGYQINQYRVRASPSPPLCPSLQTMHPSQIYRCSGLVKGRSYSFVVSAFKCQTQEEINDTFFLQPSSPALHQGTVVIANNQRKELKVQWIDRVVSNSKKCFFNNSHYTVVLEGRPELRGNMEQRRVSTDICGDDLLCSMIFPLSLPDLSYRFTIRKLNSYGSDLIATAWIDIPDSSISSESCVVFIFCSFPDVNRECVVQYGLDPSYQDLDSSRSWTIPFNTFLSLPIHKANTFYYYQVSATSLGTFRGNFTAAEGVKLKAYHYVLLSVGMISLCAAFAILIIIISTLLRIKANNNFTRLFEKAIAYKTGSYAILVIGSVLMLISLVLWVTFGCVVGSPNDPCNPTWQTSRDGLVISALIFSVFSFLVEGLAGIFFLDAYRIAEGVNSELRSINCYHNIEYCEAQRLLKAHIKTDGCYLLRPASDEGKVLYEEKVLSNGRILCGGRVVCEGRVVCTISVTNKSKLVNYRVFKNELPDEEIYYILNGLHFPSINALLAYYRNKPISEELKTFLLHPVTSLSGMINSYN